MGRPARSSPCGSHLRRGAHACTSAQAASRLPAAARRGQCPAPSCFLKTGCAASFTAPLEQAEEDVQKRKNSRRRFEFS